MYTGSIARATVRFVRHEAGTADAWAEAGCSRISRA